MDKLEAQALIQAAGGNAAFAQLLGLESEPGIRQRVHNWKNRGIPPRVILDHQLVIESLRRKAQSTRRDVDQPSLRNSAA
jgi:hypothetical protein